MKVRVSHRPLFYWIVLGILALALIGAASAKWLGQRTPSIEKRFRTDTVTRGDLTQTVSANGTLNPVVLVSVGTQVSGTVKALRADFNDHVRKGQVLLELDPALLQAQAAQSKANVANLEASVALATVTEARQRTLLAQDSIARQDYDQAQQALRSARAQLAQARAQYQKDRTNLAYATIRSPVSGVVVDRQVDVGQTVAASFQTPVLFRIAQDLRKMQIDSSFAEADIGNIRVGQPVRFNVDAFADRAFAGQVRQIRLNPTVQQNVVTYDVVVAVDNPEQILMPGMTAYVNITVAQRHDVLLVPNTALRFKAAADAPVAGRDARTAAANGAPRASTGPAATAQASAAPTGPRATVYVLRDQQLHPVSVRTGIADSRRTEVLDEGPDRLVAGDRVVTEDLKAPAPASATTGPPRVRMF